MKEFTTEYSEVSIEYTGFNNIKVEFSGSDSTATTRCSTAWLSLVIDSEAETKETIQELISAAIKDYNVDLIETQTGDKKVIEVLEEMGFEECGYNRFKPDADSKFRFWMCDEEDLEWKRDTFDFD